jgi:RIO-like serine/threonine protein kinase
VSSVGQRVGVGKEGDVYIVKGKGKGPMLVEHDDVEEQEQPVRRAGYGSDDGEDDDEMRVLKMHR